ncbi:imidazole glycerol phosphate synthase subunit HisH [Burkholderiales bacterium]|jgi:imidazole glycerol-phosphate synthase subunit HisH|nr:imidazole glycerol phosphate synthase subunit HisH [Burkholderiales bacterium]
MSRVRVAIIDYGMGNILSMRRSFEHLGAEVCVTSDHEKILAAEKVVLPGVGAFPDAMAELQNRDLVEVIRTLASSEIPLLGVCLGMQILFEFGYEFRRTPGLGILEGSVVPLPAADPDGNLHKVPHVGWAPLDMVSEGVLASGMLSNVEADESVYFTHSFMAQPKDLTIRLADCHYYDIDIAAVVGVGRVIGCQFHPEKSGYIGLRILNNFLSL